MSDLVKNIIAVVMTGAISTAATTQALSVELVNLKEQVRDFNHRVEEIDKRLVLTQIEQARRYSMVYKKNNRQ